MKIKILVFAIILFSISSCKSTKTTSTEESIIVPLSDETGIPYEISLADHLKKFSGVSVSGSGANARVRIRTGGTSVNLNTEPMFLVNGMQYGGSFSELSSTVAVIDIKSVKVYKDAAELAEFGSRGANGVIDIKLK